MRVTPRGLLPLLAAACLAVCLAVLEAPAAAAPAEESTPDKSLGAAKEAFETAQNVFVRGEYAVAAEQFLSAYEQKPYPAFLFNVAVSYEKAKQLEKAKQYFEKYLEKDPNASDAAQVKLRLDVIDKLLAPPPAAAAAVAPAAATGAPGVPPAGRAPRPPPPAGGRRPAGAPRPRRAPAATPPARRPPPPPPASPVLPDIETKGLVVIDSKPQGATIYLNDKRDGAVRQDALAGLAGIEAGPPDPGVEGVEARGARDQPALRQADRRLHRAVRGALPRLGRDDLERPGRRRVHRSQGHRRHRPDAVHRPPQARQAHHLRREVSASNPSSGTSTSSPARRRSTRWTCKPSAEGLGQRSPGATAAGGRLIVDDKFGCATPCRAEVTPGKHEILVEKKGMEDYEADLDLPRGIETTIEVQMSARPPRTRAITTAIVAAVHHRRRRLRRPSVAAEPRTPSTATSPTAR